jgi:hypothetical protein
LEKHHERVAGVEDDYITEAEQLSWSVSDISDALVNLNVLRIKDIPTQPRSAKEILTVFGLVLEQLCEEHGSGVGSHV